MKIPLALFVSLLLSLPLAARAADAKANWQKLCAKCHGPDGKGHTNMGRKLHIKDYSDAKTQSELKDDKMRDAIVHGVKDEGRIRMKAHGNELSAPEIDALIKYVRAFKK